METLLEHTIAPSNNLEAMAEIEEMILSHDGHVDLVANDGSRVQIPDQLLLVMKTVVSAMRRGKAISLVPHAMRITTQEAADILGVSRPTLIKLLEQNKLPYETPNRHRRIRLLDLLAYQEQRQQEIQDQLKEMTRDAQEMGVYERTPDEYKAALDEGRKKFA